jgi:hypothetical protein
MAKIFFITVKNIDDLVVGVPGYRSMSQGSIPDFLRVSGFRTGPTEPHEYN